jgi:hypothetical protein
MRIPKLVLPGIALFQISSLKAPGNSRLWNKGRALVLLSFKTKQRSSTSTSPVRSLFTSNNSGTKDKMSDDFRQSSTITDEQQRERSTVAPPPMSVWNGALRFSLKSRSHCFHWILRAFHRSTKVVSPPSIRLPAHCCRCHLVYLQCAKRPKSFGWSTCGCLGESSIDCGSRHFGIWCICHGECLTSSRRWSLCRCYCFALCIVSRTHPMAFKAKAVKETVTEENVFKKKRSPAGPLLFSTPTSPWYVSLFVWYCRTRDNTLPKDQ